MRFNIKLSPFPFSVNRACAEDAGVKAADWRDELADAAALAGLAFFTSLAGTAAVGVFNVAAAGVAAGSMFFTVLCMKRGLVKNKATQ